MKVNYNLMTSGQLLHEFLSNIDSGIVYLKGENPLLVNVGGEEMYVYIKNLSPARLSNHNADIWRIQLPVKEEFDSIKLSQKLFILLGYDHKNNVYTSWNPFWCKQRLNIGKSVSMYSRLSLQMKVGQRGNIETLNLNNNGIVVCIPKYKLGEYLRHVKDYFVDDTYFIAKGSRIQKRLKMLNDNERTFEIFKSQIITCDFFNYLLKRKISEKTAQRYIKHLRDLLKAGSFDKYKDLFLNYNRFIDYDSAIQAYLQKNEVAVWDFHSHRYYSSALRHYLNFLIYKYEDVHLFNSQNIVDVSNKIDEIHYDIDEFGKLISLDNNIKSKLSKFIVDEDYPDFDEMIQIVRTYYPHDVLDKMSYVDWVNLFETENWKKNYTSKYTELNHKKLPRQILKITRADGTVLQNKFAADTYAQIIDEIGPKRVMNLGIMYAGVNIVSENYDAKYHDYQRKIGDDYLVLVNMPNEKKLEHLVYISQQLNLQLIVQLVDKDDCTAFNKGTSQLHSKHQLIQVTYPDGRITQYHKVLQTLVDVVNYAGPGNVEKLNLTVCYRNLILRRPHDEYVTACKQVNDNWFVNTYSNTKTKYAQICEISDKLNLGLKVELI